MKNIILYLLVLLVGSELMLYTEKVEYFLLFAAAMGALVTLRNFFHYLALGLVMGAATYFLLDPSELLQEKIGAILPFSAILYALLSILVSSLTFAITAYTVNRLLRNKKTKAFIWNS